MLWSIKPIQQWFVKCSINANIKHDSCVFFDVKPFFRTFTLKNRKKKSPLLFRCFFREKGQIAAQLPLPIHFRKAHLDPKGSISIQPGHLKWPLHGHVTPEQSYWTAGYLSWWVYKPRGHHLVQIWSSSSCFAIYAHLTSVLSWCHYHVHRILDHSLFVMQQQKSIQLVVSWTFKFQRGLPLTFVGRIWNHHDKTRILQVLFSSDLANITHLKSSVVC